MNNNILKEKIEFILDDFKRKNFEQAILKSKKLLEEIPNNDFLLNLIGMCYSNLSDLNKASHFFLEAIKKNSSNLAAKNNYAMVLKAQNQLDEAKKLLKAILDVNPKNITALNNSANIEKDDRNFDKAISFYQKILEQDEKNITAHYNISMCYQDLRDNEKALKHAKEINKINPNFTAADKIISTIYDYKKEGKDHFYEMKQKDLNLKLDNEQKISLYFSLGKAYEDNDQFENAATYYKLANKNGKILHDYNFKKENKTFNEIKDLFTNEKILDLKFKDNLSKKIIFICGMPRSGSTLLEQIISTHSEIGSMGETDFFKKSFMNFLNISDKNFIEIIKNHSKNEKNQIFEHYLNQTKRLKINSNILTDKSLLNFKYLGFIKILFPNSKIIIISRDFKDNLLSIFKNNLPAVKWTYDINDIKQFYKIYQNYVLLWSDKMNNDLIQIEYEDLVKNTEGVIKKIINFCDIKWEDQLLEYYKKNKAPIKTASVNQADKPIYKKSLNKYLKFEKFLDL